MDIIHSLPLCNWDETQAFAAPLSYELTQSLETGKILFFPQLAFELVPAEKRFLFPQIADPRAKNIGYQAAQDKLWGVQHLTDEEHLQLKAMLSRFANHATKLIHSIFPSYTQALIMGRTSFRPVQISDRKTSYRKDDKRLHVDAFPSAPNQGKRILRVFSNINPINEARIWRIGEPFAEVVEQFLPRLKKPLPGLARTLRLLKITKSYRTAYDHYMLQLHDQMKKDEAYQAKAKQIEMHFPAGSTWIVQTDHVSHAAMSGQHLLEQTFYLPVEAMQAENLAPLRILERKLKRTLA